MTILIAEDDAFSRKLIEATLERAGHKVISCTDGESALRKYKEFPQIEMAILDWMMPGMDGLELCQEIKANEEYLTFIIMLTAKNRTEDIALALNSGADDFVSKPFKALELNARINAGIRMVRLQRAMMANITELQDALIHVNQLQRLLPVCPSCKKVRDDAQHRCSIDDYLSQCSKAQLSQCFCPECEKEQFPERYAKEEALA